jgi:hypothetical protein
LTDIKAYSELAEVSFKDFLGTSICEWEEEFGRLQMSLFLKIQLRKLHAAGGLQEVSTLVSTVDHPPTLLSRTKLTLKRLC